MTRFRILTAGGVCLVAAMSSAVFSQDKTPADPAKAVIDAFVKTLQSDKQIDEAQRKAALQAVEKFSQSKETRDLAITQALREISPELRKALNALGNEDFKAAAAELKPLTTSKNVFLASESRYFLARTLMLQERYELALPYLVQITGDPSTTLRAGESLFLKGAAELQLLKRKEAVTSLTRFLKEHANAPERLRVAAWRQLEALRGIEKGSMPDIHQHMEFSRRKLAQEISGEKTQTVQKQIVAMLNTLIEEVEKRGGS